MSDPFTIPRSRRARHVPLAAALLLTVALASGCFRLVERETFAIGAETNRVNLVVHTKASKALYDIARMHGTATARSIVVSQTPPTVSISRLQKATLCGFSVALCLSADQIGRTLVSWFKSDIRHRSDFWEALSSAGRSGRCFTWTVVPSRNLTHKGLGTSGCGRGK